MKSRIMETTMNEERSETGRQVQVNGSEHDAKQCCTDCIYNHTYQRWVNVCGKVNHLGI